MVKNTFRIVFSLFFGKTTVENKLIQLEVFNTSIQTHMDEKSNTKQIYEFYTCKIRGV